MRDINVSIQGLEMDYQTARVMADSLACMLEHEPILMAWHDKPHHKMGPAIEGADLNTRWRDYGRSFGGDLEISINGDYDFIFADSTEFESASATENPYVSMRDEAGKEYICMRTVKSGKPEMVCTSLEEAAEGDAGR